MARRLQSPVVRAAALAAFAIFIAPLLPIAGAAPTPSPSPEPPHPAAAPSLTPALPTPSPVAQPSPTAKPKPPPPKPDEWTEALHLFEQLSPDQQKRFFDNLDQWKTMSPGQQEFFRDVERSRNDKIVQEIQQAIAKSNLGLDEDRREVYALRYTQERRKIEESLRKEMDQKRQVMVNDMLARLKIEFSATPTPAPKPTAGH